MKKKTLTLSLLAALWGQPLYAEVPNLEPELVGAQSAASPATADPMAPKLSGNSTASCFCICASNSLGWGYWVGFMGATYVFTKVFDRLMNLVELQLIINNNPHHHFKVD